VSLSTIEIPGMALGFGLNVSAMDGYPKFISGGHWRWKYGFIYGGRIVM
jgi:hypothetical protein